MKNFLKIVVILISLCFMPLFINATSTFEDGKAIANKYMKENFDDDYTKYIVSENTKYGFSKEKGIFNVSGFNKGGFINKYEYDLSSNSGSESSSWLYDANGYWSLTENDGNIYVIGKGNSDKGKEFNNRVVEYVRNTTKVSGKGTYSNPWVIVKTYSVTIKANRNDLLDSIYYKSKECGKDSCKADVFINKNAEFYLNFKDGYEYDLSGSGANLCNSSGYFASSGKLVISNVVDDIECYFNIKESEYKITFDANGGTLSGDNSKNVTYTKSYGTLPEPIREGYIFSGWYTEKVNGNKIDSSSILDTAGDKTLYAHWTASSYTVTFNPNGGTLTGSSSKSVTYDTKYGDLPTASREGYAFLGWYTDSTNGSVITSETTVKIKKAITLYAHWKAKNYTVTFNGNGGTPSFSSKTVVYDTKYGDLPIASRSGYTFLGWYTTASDGSKITNDYIFKVGSNQTLYAHWKSNTYTTTFYVGTTLISSETYSVGASITYPSKKTIANKIYTRKFIKTDVIKLEGEDREWYDVEWYDVVFFDPTYSSTLKLQPEENLNIYITMNKKTCYTQFGEGGSGNGTSQLSRLNNAGSDYKYSDYCYTDSKHQTLTCKGTCDEIYGLYLRSWEILPSCPWNNRTNGYSTFRSFNIEDSWGRDDTRNANC
jgi:uncharacterized repeat protein (TIGR02543 family)